MTYGRRAPAPAEGPLKQSLDTRPRSASAHAGEMLPRRLAMATMRRNALTRRRHPGRWVASGSHASSPATCRRNRFESFAGAQSTVSSFSR